MKGEQDTKMGEASEQGEKFRRVGFTPFPALINVPCFSYIKGNIK